MKRRHPLSKFGLYVSDFDKLDPSDTVFLTLCRTECDILVVAMPTDYSMRLNGKKSLFSTDERSFRVGSLTVVNFICRFDEESPSLAIDKINPDFIFYGRRKNDKDQYADILQKNKLFEIKYPWSDDGTPAYKFNDGKYWKIPSVIDVDVETD